MRNIGPVSRRWLHAIEVYSLEDLKKVGSIRAYRMIRAMGFKVSLNLLYALEGAVRDVHWTQLPPKIKEKLKKAHESS